jgi:hypothetical protein
MASTINATPTSSGLIQSADNSGVLALQTGGTTAVTIDGSQNVGIGTSSPSVKLELSGAAAQNQYLVNTSVSVGSKLGGAYFYSSATSNGWYSGIESFVPSGSPGIDRTDLRFFTTSVTPTERMRIDSSGNLLVGASSLLGQPSKVLISNPSISNVGLIVQSTASSDSGTDGIRIGKYDNNSTTSQVFTRFTINNQNNGSGQINANGANQAAFGGFSDARLKENIVGLPSQLKNIAFLKPCEFDYKDGSGHQIGFIAQEMQEVYPDVVGEDSEGMLTITGWDKTTARLVKAIQELNAKVDAQAAEIQALKGVA